MHKCWFTQDSRNKSENDWCRGRGLSLVSSKQRSVAVGNKIMDTRLPQPAGCGDKYDVSGLVFKYMFSAFCKFFKYPSPDAKASPSPARGDGFVRLLHSARNDAERNNILSKGLDVVRQYAALWERRVQRGTRARKALVVTRQAKPLGRSMIEMLGVLAIIGVLSVGGIAGYSKAMMKYKINKMTEEYTMLMTGLMEYQESLFKTYTGDYNNRFLAQFIIDAKLVPETWKLVNQQFISDSLGNKINTYVNNAVNGSVFTSDIYIVPSGVNKDSEYAYQLCLALSHEVVYPLAANMDYAALFIANDAITNSNSFMVYTKSCYNSNFTKVKCLSDMTLSEISTICKSCVKKDSCYVGMSWR